jgi:hypothetical protein
VECILGSDCQEMQATPAGGEESGSVASHIAAEVQRTVTQLALDFRIYGERALRGDDEVFDRLAVLKTAFWHQYVAGLKKPRQW